MQREETMGRASRRKREQRNKAKVPDYRNEFRKAVLAEHLRELETSDAGCIVCDNPNAELTGLWVLSQEFGRRIGVPQGKTRVYGYRICESCEERSQNDGGWISEFIEAAIIARERGESIVYLGPDGMPICDPGTEPLPLKPSI
jgi:hypothetical protein